MGILKSIPIFLLERLEEKRMKICGKKYGISTFVLFIGAVVIAFCFCMMLFHTERKRQLEMQSRGFYNDYAKSFAVFDTVSKEQFQKVLQASVRDGMVFLRNLDGINMTYGVWYQGEVQKPVLESGRFFEEKECMGRERLAVVGKGCLGDVNEKEGELHIKIDGENYTVIGVLAAEADTKMGKMKFVNWEAAVCQYGIAGDYILDGKSEQAVREQMGQLAGQMSENEVYYSEGIKVEDNSLVRMFGLETLDAIYLIMFVNFIICGIFIIVYWLQKQKNYVEVYTLLGIGWGILIWDVLKKFMGAVVPGTLIGMTYLLLKEVAG